MRRPSNYMLKLQMLCVLPEKSFNQTTDLEEGKSVDTLHPHTTHFTLPGRQGIARCHGSEVSYSQLPCQSLLYRILLLLLTVVAERTLLCSERTRHAAFSASVLL